ncbi:hypothetical protein HMPREF1568_0160 [Providencia alcalifaciens PAL-3]|nr:hypothetical protein HMPREF1568_0160 [Providencia alcalifaciens PAL-3]EUD00584.1 hypothetical protein HMPREF1566_2749 [Providencia alcalifaciens PAL-1]
MHSNRKRKRLRNHFSSNLKKSAAKRKNHNRRSKLLNTLIF